MYAVCSTKKEDVAKCIQAMVAGNMHQPVFQFGAKKYLELEKDQSQVNKACRKVTEEAVYAINLDTRKIHKKTCHNQGKNTVGARLCNVGTTGLITCRKCMK